MTPVLKREAGDQISTCHTEFEEYGIEENISEIGKIWFQLNHWGKGKIVVRVSSYMEDGNEEMKAVLGINCFHIWKGWWIQMEVLQTE